MWAWLLAQVQLYNQTQRKHLEDRIKPTKDEQEEYTVNTIGAGRGGVPSLQKITKKPKKTKKRE